MTTSSDCSHTGLCTGEIFPLGIILELAASPLYPFEIKIVRLAGCRDSTRFLEHQESRKSSKHTHHKCKGHGGQVGGKEVSGEELLANS